MGFQTAVSGLRAASADLDVTGNNIANTNTTGFKLSRVEFADVYSVSSLGTTRDAIGRGVQIASLRQQFTQGNVSFTNNPLDLAINGNGLFVLEDSGARVYTRAGVFGVDENGFVVNNFGQQLIGFSATGGVVGGTEGPFQLATGLASPQATSSATVEVNVDAGATVPAVAFDPAVTGSFNNSTSVTVFDSLGGSHVATLFFRKTATNAWESHLRIDNDNTQTLAVQPLAFDTSGQMTTPMPVGYGAFTPTNGAAPFTVNFDLTTTTQLEGSFGVSALAQNGFSAGRLAGIGVEADGTVLARFTNGNTEAQGQVALADFANVEGLQPISDTTWQETTSSGPPLIGAPGSATLGLVQSGALEESNVDLAEQLVKMIIAQRNFQANAQLIQTQDEVTQTVINIR